MRTASASEHLKCCSGGVRIASQSLFRDAYRENHRSTWQTAKGIVSRKYGKPIYTVASAYKVISSLNCLDKVAKKVVSTLTFSESDEMFHYRELNSLQA